MFKKIFELYQVSVWQNVSILQMCIKSITQYILVLKIKLKIKTKILVILDKKVVLTRKKIKTICLTKKLFYIVLKTTVFF